MIKASIPWPKKTTPIGLDIGSRSLKLVQLCTEHRRVIESSRWDWNGADDWFDASSSDPNSTNDAFVLALKNALTGRNFEGRNVVTSISGNHFFLQNIRVPKGGKAQLEAAVHREAASRIPFPVEESEIRFWDCAEVRQGDTSMREIIVFACHRPNIVCIAQSIVAAGLNPIVVDVEPAALIRSYAAQNRRDDERGLRVMLLHFGYGVTSVIIAENEDALFVKYLDVGGRQIDEAIAEQLQLGVVEANALRKRKQLDQHIAKTLQDAGRPVIEKLLSELSMCIRYHSVTFRGRPISKLIISGGEVSTDVAETLEQRLGLSTELSNPFRRIENAPVVDTPSQWEVAFGLARRQLVAS
ncbi:MAG: type IV pilus assembly protein PilM [Pirellulaceae bacterium]